MYYFFVSWSLVARSWNKNNGFLILPTSGSITCEEKRSEHEVIRTHWQRECFHWILFIIILYDSPVNVMRCDAHTWRCVLYIQSKCTQMYSNEVWSLLNENGWIVSIFAFYCHWLYFRTFRYRARYQKKNVCINVCSDFEMCGLCSSWVLVMILNFVFTFIEIWFILIHCK